MSYETRAYDKADDNSGFGPDPVVVMVVTGTHDISRLLYTLSRGTVEQITLAEQITRQVNRHNGGRAALKLLRDHGGPDLLEKFGVAADVIDLTDRLLIALVGNAVGEDMARSVRIQLQETGLLADRRVTTDDADWSALSEACWQFTHAYASDDEDDHKVQAAIKQVQAALLGGGQ